MRKFIVAFSFYLSLNISGHVMPDYSGESLNPIEHTVSNAYATGTTIYVESSGTCGGNTPCFTTIESAIAAASDSMTIAVAQGTYSENLGIYSPITELLIQGGWNSDFSSRDGNYELTVIDGTSTSNVFNIVANGIDIALTIEGFTIKNGSTAGSGGGIDAKVYSAGSLDLKLENNDISDNSAAYGGGIDFRSESLGVGVLTLNGNLLRNNSVSMNGGGLSISSASSDSTVTVLLTNNIIVENTASGNGGGIALAATTLDLINNSISANSAGEGGGLHVLSYSSYDTTTNITNTIVWGNSVNGNDHDIFIKESSSSSAVVNASYSDIGEVLYDTPYPGTFNDLGNNLNLDPLFVSPYSAADNYSQYRNALGYHLSPRSTLINQGDNSVVSSISDDFEGDIRVIDGTVDIGADEHVVIFVEPAGLCGGNTPCYTTIQQGLDSSGDGTSIRIAEGTYFENITRTVAICGLLIQGGWSLDFSTRDSDPSLTIIDGSTKASSKVLSIDLLEMWQYIDATIDNVTITNGTSGGIDIWGFSSITYVNPFNVNIINSKITNNNGQGINIQNATYFLSSYPNITITNNVISDNNGNGLYFYAQPVISSNSIKNNNGDGIIIQSGEIANNIISGNSGNGIIASYFKCYCKATVINNLIYENGRSGILTSGYRESITLDIINNTISNNIGGGIHAFAGGSLGTHSGLTNINVSNSITWGNNAFDIYLGQAIGTTVLNASFSDIGIIVYEPEDPEHYAGPGTYNDLGNNINTDPFFITTGYWHDNGTPSDSSDD